MKKTWFVVLLFLICLLASKNALSQETPEEYEKIQIIKSTPIKLEIQSNPIIQKHIKYYQSRGRNVLKLALFRVGTQEKMLRRIFTEEGIPENLFRISQIERMWANSLKTLWVFPPTIASKYGLRKTKYLDETRSFEKATRATAQYLKFLFNKYDQNWELALGAYEAGEKNVDLAIKKANTKDYWKIFRYLPRETRNFVPNVLATILIANDPEQYGFANIKKDAPILYELVRVPPSTTFATISKLSETPIENLANLNPELILGVTPPEPYIIRVPSGKGQMFADRMRKFYKKSQENQ
ncbi:MAG: transglycosylase SLT domain-containing protein [Pyrinomonadaceae bacterium]|nr:transglycosylase SLT domain-containing protein [Pyrinomonadaceae bacterium]